MELCMCLCLSVCVHLEKPIKSSRKTLSAQRKSRFKTNAIKNEVRQSSPGTSAGIRRAVGATTEWVVSASRTAKSRQKNKKKKNKH